MMDDGVQNQEVDQSLGMEESFVIIAENVATSKRIVGYEKKNKRGKGNKMWPTTTMKKPLLLHRKVRY